jgi:hypothetical protein
MNAKIINLEPGQTSYLVSDQILISTPQDLLDILGELDFQNLVLHDYNFPPEFFDLSTRLLGDVLQKLTNYRVKLAIIGDFSRYTSQVLPDFIRESNRHGEYIFVQSLGQVKEIWQLSYS